MSEEINKNDSTLNISLKDYKVKPLFQKKNSDIIVAVILVLLSILGVSALFWHELSLGFTIVFDVALILISSFILKKGVKPGFLFFACGILSLICSGSFFITSNPIIKVITLLVIGVSSIIWLSSISGKEYKSGDYNLIIFFFTAIYRALSNISGIFKSLFSKNDSKSKTASNILIGIVCAIPAVLIVVPILSNADFAFGSLVSRIFDDYFTLIQKIILGLGISVVAISLTFSFKYDDKAYSYRELSVKVNNTTASAFLCVLSSVYLIYLFSQLAYFFSAFSSILPKDYKFTYAEYARRGFFELCIIAVINLIVIYAIILLSEKNNGKLAISAKIPSIFIILFTFIIIATAFSKMIMYINAYGCTVLRIGTSAFMAWIAILFVCILIRIFSMRFDFLKTGLVFALIITAVLGLGNINAFIADYNYNAYIDGKIKMDVKYMADIGDEGIPYLYKLTKVRDEKIAEQAKEELSYKYYNYYDFEETNIEDINSYKEFEKLQKSKEGISSFSIPLSKAYKTLEKYAKEEDGIVLVQAEEY